MASEKDNDKKIEIKNNDNYRTDLKENLNDLFSKTARLEKNLNKFKILLEDYY